MWWKHFAFNKAIPRFVILFGVDYFGGVTNWVFLVVLDCWIERIEIDVTVTLTVFKIVKEFGCIGSPTIKSVSWIKWFYYFLGEIFSEFLEIFVFS